MFVHVVSRSLPEVSRAPMSGVHTAVDQLRRAGADVAVDVGHASGDISTAVAACSESLLKQWEQRPPTIVHSIGLVATLAALAVRPPGLPVVSTFHEQPSSGAVEESLARDVDGVIPLSTAEQERWRHAGARTLAAGVMVVPEPAVDHSSVTTGGPVVCLSNGEGLDALIESMSYWGPTRLVLMGSLDEATRSRIFGKAHRLGVLSRIDYSPGLRGEDRARIWQSAALAVAVNDGARHGGHVLEAARYGIPAVAVAEDAHLDHIIPGATGVLVDPHDGARGLGLAVAGVLADPLSCKGMGSAALIRMESLAGRTVIGERLIALYRTLAVETDAEATTPTRKAAPLSEAGTKLALDYLPLARQLAQRYGGRGQRIDDLVQVAYLGLVRAASRFDPELGTEFHSFAVPTILGELRRHFRDHAWAARVPRSLQETTLKVQRVTDELRSTLGHDPSPAEIASHLGLLEEEVLQAMQARGEAMSSKSLDHPMGEDGDESFGDLVGELDPGMEYVESREAVRTALSALPEREREILLMRFYGEYTQSEIAERLGLSQVHVSRLITRTLAALRDHIVNDVPLPRSWVEEPDSTEETEFESTGQRAFAA